VSVLAFLTVVGALTLALSWAVAGVLYPLWGRLVAERVGLARGTLVVAALPALLAAGVVAASVLPAWFDTLFICHSGPGWLHLCWCHPDNAAGALPFAAGALLLLVPGRVRALWSVGREPLGSGSAPLVTELQRPIALLVGWLRPSVVIDARLWAALTAPQRDAVLAHEQAHIDRRDPLMLLLLRVITSVAPAHARSALLRSWLDRAETRADALAVRAVGDPVIVAEALLRTARLNLESPRLALGWGGGTLERRIGAILDAGIDDTSSAPDAGLLDALALATVSVAVLLASPAMHHQLEHLLNS